MSVYCINILICRRFEKKHLAQIKSVYPSSLEFHQDRSATKSSLFELTIEFGKGEGLHSKLTLTATELLARKDVFERNLLKLTKKHHQVPVTFKSHFYLVNTVVFCKYLHFMFLVNFTIALASYYVI